MRRPHFTKEVVHMALLEGYQALLRAVGETRGVQSIGKSGGEKLPERNESDIDLFVFCDAVPDLDARRAAMDKLGAAASDVQLSEHAGGFWGVCDFVTIEEAEICLMYFSLDEMSGEIDSVLSGSRLDREGEYFYPTGRCATLLSMHALLDRGGYISAMKTRLSRYPEELAVKLARHHLGKIGNEEDFERAVSRG